MKLAGLDYWRQPSEATAPDQTGQRHSFDAPPRGPVLNGPAPVPGPPEDEAATRRRGRTVAVAWASGLALLAVLYWFPPQDHALYPRCLWYAATGWQCPGCGGLRAVHALLHGQLATAFHYNPLVVALAPLAGVMGLGRLAQWAWGWPACSLQARGAWLWLLVGVMLAFAVLRNLLTL